MHLTYWIWRTCLLIDYTNRGMPAAYLATPAGEPSLSIVGAGLTASK